MHQLRQIQRLLIRLNMAILMALTVVVMPVAAQESALDIKQVMVADDAGSLWLSYGPKTTFAYSFWYQGQSGIKADWTLPTGYSLGTLRLPALSETGDRGSPTFTFSHDSRLLQQIIVEDGANTDISSITLRLTYGSCADTCMQQTGHATLDLRAESLPSIDTKSLPVRKRGIWARADGKSLSIGMHKKYNNDGRVDRAFFLPLDPMLIDGPAPLRLAPFKETGFFSSFALKSPVAADALIKGVLVLDKPDDGGLEFYVVMPKNDFARAATMSEMPEASLSPKSSLSDALPSYVIAIVLALIGGLILNVMPCVFPILALKVFSVIKSSASLEAEIKKDALAYTFGVIASFALLAGVLIAIRSAGIGAGWGYQLQSPTFVLVMALIFFVMGLNFLGVFEVPGFLSGAGQSLTGRKGARGSFFTGVLATLVAAPCTAPFMVTAVAFALAQPPLMAISIFMALGLGLSLPYLLIGYVPATRRFFPKAGAWMVTFRSFLAFPMFATMVWMVWILSIQSGSTGVLLALTPMVLIAFAIWVSRVLTGLPKSLIIVLSAIAVLYALSTIKPVAKHMPRGAMQVASSDKSMIGAMEVIPFSEEKLTSLRIEGKNVFVHHWAAWCMVCLMHENLVFSQDDFQSFLRDNTIVFMMADRTNNDPELIAFMEKAYGRSSQPIDVFYSHDLSVKPIVFPTLFTTGKVTEIMRATLKGK